MVTENTQQYLTFTLDEDSFAIEILKVREVLDYVEPTRVPRSPEFLVGAIVAWRQYQTLIHQFS